MRVAILHNEILPDKPDQADVLAEVKLVEAALERLDFPRAVFTLGSGLGSLMKLLHDVAGFQPDVLFNLVEAFGDDPRLQAGSAAIFDLAGWPYTGSDFSAILATTDKTLLKSVLRQAGIPTPAWEVYTGTPKPIALASPWLIKPAWEDGSVGIDDQSLITAPERLQAKLQETFARHGGQPLVVETYIEGREFNVALLEHAGGRVEILPPAEIVFEDWPADKPRIVNYDAKWSPGTFEYQHTPRSFALDERLQSELRAVSLLCWNAFQLHGYARIDLRMDAAGNILVMEVNSNPCLAPECGFIAAAHEAGYAPHAVIEKIILQPLAARSKRPC